MSQIIPPFALNQGVGHLYNYTPGSTRRIRAAMAKARTKAASGAIACIGDSNVRGTGSAVGGAQGYNGWPVQLAALLTAAGVKAQCENFFGTGGYGGSFSSFDSRIVFSGSGISQPNGSGLVCPGGWLFYASATGSLTFTTQTACTACDIFYFGSSSAGSMSYQVDGGSATTFSCVQASSNIYKLTISLGALATHAVTLNWISGGVYLVGMDCYDATTPLLHIWNWGWHGSTSAQWTNQATGSTTTPTSKWLPLNCIAGSSAVQPAGIIGPALGINDMNTTNNMSAATVQANKQLLLSSWAATSDTILLTEGPSAAATVPSLAVQQSYNALDWQLALSNNIPMLDELGWMGDEPTMEALGIYNTDHLHKTYAGHSITAHMVRNALLAIS